MYMVVYGVQYSGLWLVISIYLIYEMFAPVLNYKYVLFSLCEFRFASFYSIPRCFTQEQCTQSQREHP